MISDDLVVVVVFNGKVFRFILLAYLSKSHMFVCLCNASRGFVILTSVELFGEIVGIGIKVGHALTVL